jgi:pilus assembly protein CpaE
VVTADERVDGTVSEAMQAGARQCLAKDDLSTELVRTLRQLLPNGQGKTEAAAGGAAVTVLSAAGGTGATTIAVNLASELRGLTAEAAAGATASPDVLLVDLDHQYGAIASYLGLSGQYGLADVLAHHETIDPQLVRSTAVNHCEHLDVLLSPATVDFAKPDPIHDQRLETAIEACKRAYSWTVIDAPRASMDVAATLARASNATLIVMQLAVKDIRCARTMLAALADRGIAPDSLLPVANRFERRGLSVSLEEAERAMGGRTLKRISNDYRSAIEGINFGVPLNQSARRSLLRRDLRDLATELHRVHTVRHSTAAR